MDPKKKPEPEFTKGKIGIKSNPALPGIVLLTLTGLTNDGDDIELRFNLEQWSQLDRGVRASLTKYLDA